MGTPLKLSAADRTRPTVWDALVALLVLAAAVLLFFALRPAPSNFLTATVVLDGETIAQYDLNALAQPVKLTLSDCPYPLVIEAEPGRIRIAQTTCPGGDCARTGWAGTPGQQIICLPNRLMISLSGGSGPSIDGVTG